MGLKSSKAREMIISNSDLTFAFCLYLEIDLMLTVSKFSFILGHPVAISFKGKD